MGPRTESNNLRVSKQKLPPWMRTRGTTKTKLVVRPAVCYHPGNLIYKQDIVTLIPNYQNMKALDKKAAILHIVSKTIPLRWKKAWNALLDWDQHKSFPPNTEIDKAATHVTSLFENPFILLPFRLPFDSEIITDMGLDFLLQYPVRMNLQVLLDAARNAFQPEALQAS